MSVLKIFKQGTCYQEGFQLIHKAGRLTKGAAKKCAIHQSQEPCNSPITGFSQCPLNCRRLADHVFISYAKVVDRFIFTLKVI